MENYSVLFLAYALGVSISARPLWHCPLPKYEALSRAGRASQEQLGPCFGRSQRNRRLRPGAEAEQLPDLDHLDINWTKAEKMTTNYGLL